MDVHHALRRVDGLVGPRRGVAETPDGGERGQQTRGKRSGEGDQIGKVTLVGAGMKSEPGVAAKMFRVLGEEGINLQMIDTSTIRITVVIDRREVERAVRALHDAFDLASEAARREAEAMLRADV